MGVIIESKKFLESWCEMFKKSSQEKSAVKKIFWQSFISFALYYSAYTAGVFVDGVIVGNFLGVDMLAAYSLLLPALFFFIFIHSVTTSGSRSIFTELLGQGKLDEANAVFTLANIFCFSFSLAVAIGIFIFANSIMRFLGATGQNANLEQYGADYIRGYSLGLVFYYCAKLLHGYMNIDSDYKRTVYAIVIMTLVNIAGDLYVVLYTDSGIFGLALATSLSHFVYFVVLALHFTRKKRMLHFKLPQKLVFSPHYAISTLLEICRRGFASAATRTFQSISGILINYIITACAVNYALAAYGLQSQILKFFEIIHLGTAETVLIMSSVYYGEEDKNSLDELQIYSMLNGIFWAVICGFLSFIFSGAIARLYMGRAEPKALAMGSEAIKYFALSMPFFVINYSASSYLNGVKRFRAANIFVFLQKLFIPVVCVYIMVKIFGVRGSWLAAPICAVILTIICGLYIYFEKVPKNIKKRLLLDKKFFKDDGTELSLIADSMFEVMGMSRISRLFCLENNFSEKIALRLALCIEEMCGNIINHGFNDGKQHYIYLRILAKEDRIILRIRDDCKAFNPLEYHKMTSQNDDDPAKNIGIRLVMKMCSDIIYLSMFKTNNLIITLPKEQEQEKISKIKFLSNKNF